MAKQSIKKNFVLNTAYQILTLITPLVTAPYVSRVLGASGVGIYSYTSSVVAFFTLFAVLGTSTYGQREIARCRDDKNKCSATFWSIEALSVFTTCISLALWLVFVVIYPEYKIYFLILSLDLFAAAFDIIWFYSGLENYSLIVLRNSIIKLLSVALIFICVKSATDVWIYVLIMAAGKFIGNVSMWIPLRKLVEKPILRNIDIKPHLKETMAYFIPVAASSIYSYLDKVMLGAFTSSTVENGYYEQAQKIIKMGYTILASLNTVMAPRMSYLFAKKNDDVIKQRMEDGAAFILTLGIPLTVGVACIAYDFVPWFFGPGFEKVSILMVLSAPLILIMAIHNFLAALYLVPSGQRVRSTKGVITGAVVNATLNAVLIPRFQSVGAVVATLVGESSICAVYFYMSRGYVPFRRCARYIPKQTVSVLVMAVVLYLFEFSGLVGITLTILKIAAGCFTYGVMLIILREKFTVGYLRWIIVAVKRRKN